MMRSAENGPILRRLLSTLATAIMAVAVLMYLLSWMFQRDPQRPPACATLGEIGHEFIRALSGNTTWAAGVSASAYSLIGATLSLALNGFVVGLIAALLIGFLFSLRPSWAWLYLTMLSPLRAIPLTLLAAALVLFPSWTQWMGITVGTTEDLPGTDPTPLIALGCFLYVSVGVVDGLSNRNKDREILFRKVVGMGRIRYVLFVLHYEMRQYVLTACRLAVLFALVLAIVFEQLLAYPGAGRRIADLVGSPSSAISTPPFAEAQAAALLAIVAMTGILLDLGVAGVRRSLLRWHR